MLVKKYYFNDINLNINDDFDKENFKNINEKIKKFKR